MTHGRPAFAGGEAGREAISPRDAGTLRARRSRPSHRRILSVPLPREVNAHGLPHERFDGQLGEGKLHTTRTNALMAGMGCESRSGFCGTTPTSAPSPEVKRD